MATLAKNNSHQPIGDYIDLCHHYYAVATFSTSGLEKQVQSFKRSLRQSGRTNPRLFISSHRPAPDRPSAAVVKVRDVMANCRKDSAYSDVVRKSILVTMYAEWDENFRQRVADSIGASTKDNVYCDVIGDIRYIRNWIVHRQSRPDYRLKKLKVIQWDLVEDEPMNITGDMFEHLMECINEQFHVFNPKEKEDAELLATAKKDAVF